MSDKTGPADRDDGAAELLDGVAQVISATLGVGAAAARMVAQATAAGREVPPPAAGAGPLNAIVHYGMATVSQLTGLVFRSAGGTAATPQGGGAAPASPRPGRGPQVHQGSTLRIPLSIENPGDVPMTGLSFRCLELSYLGLGKVEGETLSVEALRFHPVLLDVQPRDFEKLTVFVDTRDDTAPGCYRARIGMGDGGFETAFEIEVIPR